MYVKPFNCTCKYPEVILRNMNGHDPSCPVYKEWLVLTTFGKTDNTFKVSGVHVRITDERMDQFIKQAKSAATESSGGGDGEPYREVFHEAVFIATLNALIANETAADKTVKEPAKDEACHHPVLDYGPVAFISEQLNATVFAGTKHFNGTELVVDHAMRDNRIHFVQPDGTCVKYNV